VNILYYIKNLSQEWGGVRQYAKGILELMAKDSNNKYIVYHNNSDPEIMEVLSCNPQLILVKNSDISFFRKLSINRKRLIKGLNILCRALRINKQMAIPTFTDAFCDQFAIDVIHCPFQYIPKTRKARLITTLHDVQELHFPEFFSPQARANRAVSYLDYLSRADKVIVSYEHIKNDLIKYFQVLKDDIDVLLIRMNDLWINRFSEVKVIDTSDIADKDTFLLYPANTWKHKNHLNLIRAMVLLRDKFNINVKIICTGHKNNFEEIDNLIIKLNMGDQITFTGIVSEQVLYSLYKTCRAVVIPSLYEAGSFPLYESILLNVPVICSNVTSLPETIDNNECLFDPFCVESIALKMKEIWTDKDFRNKTKEKLKVIATKLNSNNPLPILQNIYSSLVN